MTPLQERIISKEITPVNTKCNHLSAIIGDAYKKLDQERINHVYNSRKKKLLIFIRLKNIAYTVRKLGYPSRSVLSNWICEDVKNHQSGILKGKNIVQYTLEEKIMQL